jgi:hypothetical protein
MNNPCCICHNREAAIWAGQFSNSGACGNVECFVIRYHQIQSAELLRIKKQEDKATKRALRKSSAQSQARQVSMTDVKNCQDNLTPTSDH